MNSAYAWNDLIRTLNNVTNEDKIVDLKEVQSVENQLKFANSKLGEIALILQEYYTGSYTTIEELAGEISVVLYGEDDD